MLVYHGLSALMLHLPHTVLRHGLSARSSPATLHDLPETSHRPSPFPHTGEVGPTWARPATSASFCGHHCHQRRASSPGAAIPSPSGVPSPSSLYATHSPRSLFLTLPTALCLSASVTDAVPQESNLHAPGAGCYVLNYVGRYAEATGRLHFAHLLLVTVAPYLSLATC